VGPYRAGVPTYHGVGMVYGPPSSSMGLRALSWPRYPIKRGGGGRRGPMGLGDLSWPRCAINRGRRRRGGTCLGLVTPLKKRGEKGGGTCLGHVITGRGEERGGLEASHAPLFSTKTSRFST